MNRRALFGFIAALFPATAIAAQPKPPEPVERWRMVVGAIPPPWMRDRWHWGATLPKGYDFAPSPGPDNDWGHTALVRTPNGIVTAKRGDFIVLRGGKLYVEAS